MNKKIKLNSFEKDIEDNFEKHQSAVSKKGMAKMLQAAAKKQLKDKK